MSFLDLHVFMEIFRKILVKPKLKELAAIGWNAHKIKYMLI